MNIFSSIVLGAIQGVAEFLPISSSGHLSLFQHFFGLANPEETLFFDVLLHLGTLIAVFIYYWRDIVELIQEFFRLVGCVVSKKKREQVGRLSPSGRMILMIIVATLPLFVILPIKDKVESLYGNTIFIGIALLVTGFLLFWSDRMGRGRKTARSATMLDALLVGVGQAIAVVPGLSRSGTSISVGLMRGFRRTFAVRFSFLMSIPAVLGANILSIVDAVQTGIEVSEIPVYIVGTIVAAVAGYFAIRMVNNLAGRGKFGAFAYYCWGVGAAAVITSLIIPMA
ncbi:MAG: undecaprenyl-diphosphate phosphatase [Ruminiclostridium sp.]|nr:undecaprenyl-diphosphate phosphatase [Ruminiclostridium sp.]